MDPQLGADQHEDVTESREFTKRAETYTSEQVGAVQVEEPGEESDEGGVGVKADARMEAIATETGKERAREEDDQGEEEVAEQAEMACVERVSQHDDSKGSADDTDVGETKQAGVDAVKHGTATPQGKADDENSDGSGHDAAGSEHVAAEGDDAAEREDAAEGEVAAEGEDVAEGAVGAAQVTSAVAAAQGMQNDSAKGLCIKRPETSHPETPAKKSRKADEHSGAKLAPVASPARSALGALAQRLGINAVAGMARDPSFGRRSRSPRAGRASTETQGKAEPANTSATAGQMKPHRGRSAGSVKQLTPASLMLVQGARQTRSEQPKPETVGLGENVGPGEKCGQILEKQLKAKKKIMNELASQNDFTGAAVAQEAVKELEANAEQLRADKTMMAELAEKGEYAEAAAVVEKIKALEEHLMALDPERLACEDVVASAEFTQPVGLLEQQLQLAEQLSAAKMIRDELASKFDYSGAADAQEEVKKLETLAEQLHAKNTMVDEPAAAREQQLEVQKRMLDVPAANSRSS